MESARESFCLAASESGASVNITSPVRGHLRPDFLSLRFLEFRRNCPRLTRRHSYGMFCCNDVTGWQHVVLMGQVQDSLGNRRTEFTFTCWIKPLIAFVITWSRSANRVRISRSAQLSPADSTYPEFWFWNGTFWWHLRQKVGAKSWILLKSEEPRPQPSVPQPLASDFSLSVGFSLFVGKTMVLVWFHLFPTSLL